MKFYVPPDNDELREQYEPRYGTCCPSAIAVLQETTVKNVIDCWATKQGGKYRGFAPLKETKEVLTQRGIRFVWKGGKKARVFPKPETGCALVRISWLREDGTEFYWMGAPSHFVLLVKDPQQSTLSGADSGLWWVFCNAHKWFPLIGNREKEYLRRGYVSSYFEISKEGMV